MNLEYCTLVLKKIGPEKNRISDRQNDKLHYIRNTYEVI